jgi:hypothetical protein
MAGQTLPRGEAWASGDGHRLKSSGGRDPDGKSAGTLAIPALDAVLAVYHLRAEPSAMTMLASDAKANRTRVASSRSRALLIT